MGKIVFFKEYRNFDQFRIDYPYYGLFGSANVTRMLVNEELIFKCALFNGSFVTVKMSEGTKWIDAELNKETPLSSTIGMAIEDFLKKEKSE